MGMGPIFYFLMQLPSIIIIIIIIFRVWMNQVDEPQISSILRNIYEFIFIYYNFLFWLLFDKFRQKRNNLYRILILYYPHTEH